MIILLFHTTVKMCINYASDLANKVNEFTRKQLPVCEKKNGQTQTDAAFLPYQPN